MANYMNDIWQFLGTILDNTELCYGVAMMLFGIAIILMGHIISSQEEEISELHAEIVKLKKGVGASAKV